MRLKRLYGNVKFGVGPCNRRVASTMTSTLTKTSHLMTFEQIEKQWKQIVNENMENRKRKVVSRDEGARKT